jgi:hypothetical protein
MSPKFVQLNLGWNAEPNAPNPRTRVDGADLVLEFFVNAFLYKEFDEEEKGILRFLRCSQFRLGPTNDEGWYLGQCRFSKLAPKWGKFYAIINDPDSLVGPNDWIGLGNGEPPKPIHFLFYFRDNTFECVAERCLIEAVPQNALTRRNKSIPGV